jgi:hypothetical protein
MGIKEIKERHGRIFTILLGVSRFSVFVLFMYVSMVMYLLGRSFESIAIIIAVAIFLILNKLEGG